MKISFPEPQARQTQLMEWLQGNKAKRKRRYPTPQKKVEQSKDHDELHETNEDELRSMKQRHQKATELPEGRPGAKGDGLGERERKTWGANKWG